MITHQVVVIGAASLVACLRLLACATNRVRGADAREQHRDGHKDGVDDGSLHLVDCLLGCRDFMLWAEVLWV